MRPRYRLTLALFATLGLSHLPALALPHPYFADDWSYVYLVHFDNLAAILRSMLEAGHPLYGPWAVGTFGLGNVGDWLLRLAALAAHGLNVYLLFRLLHRPLITRRIAILAAAIFLVSPFYSIRGPAANSIYDPVVTAWLFSVLWMDHPSRWRRALAPVCLIYGMAVETMLMLEPLRLLYAWRPGCNAWSVLRRVWLFWAVGMAIILLRIFVYRPSGYYVGFHSLLFDPAAVAGQVAESFRHIPESLKLAALEARYVLPLWQLMLLIGIAVFAFWRLVPQRTVRTELLAIPLGLALFALAALPYALIGEHLWPYRFESRFALPAQFGAIIALSATIQAIPCTRLRWGLASILLFVASLSVAGDGKWLHLDRSLQRDLTAQLTNVLKDLPEPAVIRLAFEPASRHILFRNRCLGANDLNVPLALVDGNHRPRSFVYETECGDLTPERPYCTVSYFDRQPCPSVRIDIRYVIDTQNSAIVNTSLWDALGLTGRSIKGRLERSGGATSLR